MPGGRGFFGAPWKGHANNILSFGLGVLQTQLHQKEKGDKIHENRLLY